MGFSKACPHLQHFRITQHSPYVGRSQQTSAGFQRSLSIKKSLFSVSIHVCSCLLDGEHAVSQHSLGKKLSHPNLPGHLKSKVNVFLIIFFHCKPLPHCDCYLTCCPLWALGEEGRSSVRVREERGDESQPRSDLFIFIRKESTALSV